MKTSPPDERFVDVRLVCTGALLLFCSSRVAWAQTEEQPEKFLQWSDLLSGDSTLKFYGYLRLDSAWNDSRFNDPQIPGYVLSEDPAAPAGIGATKDNEEFTMHPRLTRFGAVFDGPTVDGLGAAEVDGRIEIDFYNSGFDTDSREAIRMRRGFLELGWEHFRLLAGQEWDVISPLYPAVNYDLVMWGAGNLGDRRPQVRLQHETPLFEGQLTSAIALGLTGAVSGTTVLAGLRSGENSGRPMASARIGYKSSGGIGVGIWGHDARETFDVDSGGPFEEQDFTSNSVGVDFSVPFGSGSTWLKGEAWMGRNLADVRGGIFQGVNPATANEIEAQGGWIELGHKLTKSLTLSVGASQDDPEEEDLSANMRSKNTVAYAAANWSLGAVKLGLEYLDWETEYLGLSGGEANRIAFWISYTF